MQEIKHDSSAVENLSVERVAENAASLNLWKDIAPSLSGLSNDRNNNLSQTNDRSRVSSDAAGKTQDSGHLTRSPWASESKAESASGHGRSPWETAPKTPQAQDKQTPEIPSWLNPKVPKPDQSEAKQPAPAPKPGEQKPAPGPETKPAPWPGSNPKPNEAPAPSEAKPKPNETKLVPIDIKPADPNPLPLPPFKLPDLAPRPRPNDSPLPNSYRDHLPPFSIGSDSGPGKFYELMRLDNRAGDHSTPDAVVRIPADFDPSKPINLVIYNHGWGSTARSVVAQNNLDEQMRKAPPNSVLLIPEWQRNAGANSGDQGRFSQEGLFRNMVQEVFNKTDALRGKTVNDIANIDIFSHSAGYGPSQTEIYKNGLGDKVRSITLLDSNYNETGFDKWIQDNIHDLSSGNKRFYNFFYGTASESKAQAERVQRMLNFAGLPTKVLKDYNNGKTVLDADTLAKNPIVFKYTTAQKPGYEPHWSTPMYYIAPVEESLRSKIRIR